MFSRVKLLATILLCVSAFSVQAQTIEKFAVCRNVVKLDPIEPANHFDKGAKAYCWMKLSGVKPGSHLFLDWYWEGRLMHASKLDLPYASMRTYGYKTMTKNGGWKVAVRTPDKKILFEYEFKAGEGVDPLTAPPVQANPQPTPGGVSVIVLNPPGKVPQRPENIGEAYPEKPQNGGQANMEVQQEPKLTFTSPSERANQYVKDPITAQSRLLLPANYDPSIEYPLVVFLPFTGGTASNLYSNYLWELTQQVDSREGGFQESYQQWLNKVSPNQPFLLLLPEGRGSAEDHSSDGFSEAIARYEQRLFTDIEQIRKEKAIDRVFLSGYSLGGDLSWALLLRNPTYFDGALVMGSRCGYAAPEHFPVLAGRGVKVCFFIGSDEKEVRLQGSKWAKWQLEKVGGETNLMVGEGLGHAAVPAQELAKALGFILW